METTSLEQWLSWSRDGYSHLPMILTVQEALSPPVWEYTVGGPANVLLESAQHGRYSYACDRPTRLVMGHPQGAEIRSPDGALILERWAGRPLEVLSRLLATRRAPRADGPPMLGGLIGVFGYDVVHTWEKLPLHARRDLPLPLYAFLEPGELFVCDHSERTLRVIVWTDLTAGGRTLQRTYTAAREQAHAALQRWSRREPAPFSPSGAQPPAKAIAPPPSFTPDRFENAVRRVLDYIAAGDTYQVNLSLRTSRPTELRAGQIYEALRRVNPSPYMGLLQLPEFALVCGSPELLVRVVDGVVSSRPIAGTRRRGDVPLEDARLSAELFASDKERAEHLMLVDLIRNDIGRVAEYGSIHVKEFMTLERYSHVMHIVSLVEGRLARGAAWPQVFASMFPGGTITGCPKVRTMEIIEELEPVGRGFYTGALGWIGYDGAMELNIIIRSLLLQAGVAHVQAGAGIVADSVPERELDEALRKAQALWVALEQAAAEIDD